MNSIGKVLDDSKGLGQGFDFVRIALSLGVVGWHAFQLAQGEGYQGEPGLAWLLSYSVLIMFFGLSGFLIAASAMRLSLKNFLINRGLRIFPALAVEVILSAMVLGPLFTTLPLSEYFTDRKFFMYFTNLFGFVYYFLPGVFDGGWVNGSIWTVPYEIACYGVISILIYYKLLKIRWIVVALSALILAIQVGLALSGYEGMTQYAHSAGEFVKMMPEQMVAWLFHDRGSKLLVSFTVGIAFYLYRYSIPFSKTLFIAVLAFMGLAEAIGQWGDEVHPISNLFMVVPGLYVVIFLGLSKLPTIPLLHRGDYSYGIYLYGWPFTQATRFIFPEYSKNWVFLLLVSLVPTLLFAAASWHLIERPILQLRRKFSFVARQRLADVPDDATAAGQPSSKAEGAPERPQVIQDQPA